jgi:hypothetical protein
VEHTYKDDCAQDGRKDTSVVEAVTITLVFMLWQLKGNLLFLCHTLPWPFQNIISCHIMPHLTLPHCTCHATLYPYRFASTFHVSLEIIQTMLERGERIKAAAVAVVAVSPAQFSRSTGHMTYKRHKLNRQWPRIYTFLLQREFTLVRKTDQFQERVIGGYLNLITPSFR